ncbi:MAG: hypothetical protein ACPLRS_05785 [Hydrogenobacter sp.]
MRSALLILTLIAMAYAVEINPAKVELVGKSVMVNGRLYPLSKNVLVKNITGENLSLESIKDARAIKIEFNQSGEIVSITVLGWWD